MLRFIKGSMTSIDGIAIYPILSLVLFFVFFVGMVYMVMKKDDKEYDEVKKSPLNED